MTRILIVDDHPLYREGMMSALRTQLDGVDLLAAGSAEQGLEILSGNPDIDLVLIDVRLPGMDGFAALAMYATKFPTVSRILISGDEEPKYLKRAFDAGASGYIPKSLPVGEVSAAINRVLDGGVYVPPDSPSPSKPPASQASLSSLTLRQLEVLRLLGEGYTNKEIANALEITERTAKAHVHAIFEGLGAENRTQAVLAAQRLGYLTA